MRAKKIGHVIVNTTSIGLGLNTSAVLWQRIGISHITIRWPPASPARDAKRADICALQPERAARFLVAKGYEQRYDLRWKSQALSYGHWHDGILRIRCVFTPLRLREIGMIKSTPQENH